MVVVAAACTQGEQGSFGLTGGGADAAYTCPPGSANAPYAVHASVTAHNPTSGSVAIRSVTAELTLVAVQGNWIQRLGDTYQAGHVPYSPTSAPPGTDTSISVTIPSACTNGKVATSARSYADYSVILLVSTSAGNFTVATRNHHRIYAA
jgi:hypothetical protein